MPRQTLFKPEKIKVMSTEEIEEFELDGKKVEIVQDFVFLCDKIEDSGSCKGEILRRLALGRAAMTGLNKIWKDKDITITTKCRIAKGDSSVFVLSRTGHFGYSSIHNSVNIIGRTFMLDLHESCHICVSMCDQHFFVIILIG